MIVQPTTDLEFVRHCIAHPRVWPHVKCDGLDLEGFEPDPKATYLEAIEGERLGIFMVEAWSPQMVEIHTALLPSAWGDKARRAASALLEHLAERGFLRAISFVPDGNTAAAAYARRAGLVQIGSIAKSYFKDGRAIDQIVYGVDLCPSQ